MAGSTSKTVHDIFQSMETGAPGSSAAAAARAWLEHHTQSLGLFIDGKFVCPVDRRTLAVSDSAGGTVCSLVCAGDEDISSCASSAAAGFKAWGELSAHRRAKVLLRLASTMQRYTQCVCELCDLCQSPCSPAALVRLAQYYAGWAQLRDTLMPEWTPRGVIEVLVSDDCSFYSIWFKAFPALAMGNAVIVVPGAKLAPPALLLAQLFMEAGLPAGALSVVTGDASVGAKVAQNCQISYLTYSGSQQDGEVLAKQTAGWGLPVSVCLSVSAVCPFIIFESADIDSAVDAVIEAAFKKKKEWQWVLCVQESVLDSVSDRLKLRMTGLKCVSLPCESDRSRVDAAVQEAVQQGATLIQSSFPPASGALYPPTVLCGLAPPSSAAVSPPPGPLLPLLSFRSAAEGAALGNRTPHGQAASIWTEDLTLALETAKSLCVGSVWVNSHSVVDPSLPQCGRRDSGNCTDGGREGMYQYLRPSLSPSSLPRSTPASLDYSAFGTAASKFMVPEGFDPSSVPRSCSQYVGGKLCKADSGCSRTVQSPGGAVLANCPDGGRKDVRNAVEAALKVQPGWLKKSPAARALSIYSLSDNLEKRRRDMAASIQAQTGLSVEEADKEVELSISRLSDWAARCDKQTGGMPPLPQTGSALSAPDALGVVGVVLPDAMPLLSLVSLLGAAVSMGNAVILVPSEKQPLPALDFIQVLQASDIPAGLVSVITGGRNQLTHALANHSEIQAIWYWGSMEGCQFLQHTCCSPLKRLWLHCEEEEGKNGGQYWTHPSPSLQEEMWREAVVWKSVWIPTA
ncbi:aldehyde dehydrogenase family 16 member A1 [Salminus brasiliensis]|uniref:aldehyde dehydrogenase family 16 member A1 n=1 Tax=Salminus brasiliensis TaxID=930266 RepID=UPI003B82E60F